MKSRPLGNVFQASSALPDEGQEYRYGPEQAFDTNPKTSWNEGKADSGIGEYISLGLYRHITIDMIEVMPGYFDQRYWVKNNRVKKLEVRTENSRSNNYANSRRTGKALSRSLHSDKNPPRRATRAPVAKIVGKSLAYIMR